MLCLHFLFAFTLRSLVPFLTSSLFSFFSLVILFYTMIPWFRQAENAFKTVFIYAQAFVSFVKMIFRIFNDKAAVEIMSHFIPSQLPSHNILFNHWSRMIRTNILSFPYLFEEFCREIRSFSRPKIGLLIIIFHGKFTYLPMCIIRL